MKIAKEMVQLEQEIKDTLKNKTMFFEKVDVHIYNIRVVFKAGIGHQVLNATIEGVNILLAKYGITCSGDWSLVVHTAGCVAMCCDFVED